MLKTVSSPNIAGHASRSSVQQLSSTSRPLATPFNESITSSNLSPVTQPRFILDLRSPEGKANVQEWYKKQACTRFTRLEYRKLRHGSAKHEFIVVWLSDSSLCRFDRRAREDERGYGLLDEGTPAEDSVHVLPSSGVEYTELQSLTEVLLSFKLLRGEDLGFILAVCESIQNHAKAATYSLIRYNCYFFSWMIVSAVARSTYNWEAATLSKSSWNNILQTTVTRAFEFSASPSFETQRTGGWKSMSSWFRRAIHKMRARSQTYPQLTTYMTGPENNNEVFQNALLFTYSNLYDTVREIPQTLLFQSQLGPALGKELRRIKSTGLLSIKLTVTNAITISRAGPIGEYFRRPLNVASYASAKSLATQTYPGIIVNKSWKRTWRKVWDAYSKMDPSLADQWRWWLIAPEGLEEELPSSEDTRETMMKAWKLAWDEIDELSAQYASIITEFETMAATMMQLIDTASDGLILDNPSQYFNGSYQTTGRHSLLLQEVIRGRIKDHFEMVDRFGFGSFQELITTAEETMCEIWVASLSITYTQEAVIRCTTWSVY